MTDGANSGPETFADLNQFAAAVGEELGPSPWIRVDQSRVDQFAATTEDRQWIHVDPERAKSGPFGETIAHGFLSLSLIPHFLSQLLEVQGVRMGINYGLNRVRFPTPVPVGSRLRATGRIDEVTAIPGGVQAAVAITITVEGQDKPACVAESLARYYE